MRTHRIVFLWHFDKRFDLGTSIRFDETTNSMQWKYYWIEIWNGFCCCCPFFSIPFGAHVRLFCLFILFSVRVFCRFAFGTVPVCAMCVWFALWLLTLPRSIQRPAASVHFVFVYLLCMRTHTHRKVGHCAFYFILIVLLIYLCGLRIYTPCLPACLPAYLLTLLFIYYYYIFFDSTFAVRVCAIRSLLGSFWLIHNVLMRTPYRIKWNWHNKISTWHEFVLNMHDEEIIFLRICVY